MSDTKYTGQTPTATPTPEAGKRTFFSNSDDGDKFWAKDSSGIATPIELGASGLDNVTIINSLADFDLPSSGTVIELNSPSQLFRTYQIACSEIDVSPYTFHSSGGGVVVIGSNRFESEIFTNSSDPMFVTDAGSLALEVLSTNNPNGDVFEFNGTPGAFNTLVTQNHIVRACQSIGVITSVLTCSLRTMTVVGTSVGGFQFAGTNKQLNVTNMLAGEFISGLQWNGSLFDLVTDSPTFEIIVMSGDNRWLSTSGNVILEALGSNANFLNTNSRGIIDGNIFNGTGTHLSGGISPQDSQWNFTNNFGVDDSRELAAGNVNIAGGAYTTTNPGDNSFVALVATFIQLSQTSRFTIATNGVITYDGIADKDVRLSGIIESQRAAGSGPQLAYFRWAKSTDGGSTFLDIDVNSYGQVDNDNRVKQVGTTTYSTASNGDKYRLEWANIDSTSVDLSTLGVQFDIAAF